MKQDNNCIVNFVSLIMRESYVVGGSVVHSPLPMTKTTNLDRENFTGPLASSCSSGHMLSLESDLKLK